MDEDAPERDAPPAQDRPDPGEQLLERERLGQVVVGAGLEALDRSSTSPRAVSIRTPTSPRGAQATADLEAVEARAACGRG